MASLTCVKMCEYGRKSWTTVYAHTHAVIAFRTAGPGTRWTADGRLVFVVDWRQWPTTDRNIPDTVAGSQNTGVMATQTYGNMPSRATGDRGTSVAECTNKQRTVVVTHEKSFCNTDMCTVP